MTTLTLHLHLQQKHLGQDFAPSCFSDLQSLGPLKNCFKCKILQVVHVKMEAEEELWDQGYTE